HTVRVPLPARLLHTWNHTLVRHLAEANPANAELAVHGPRAAAQLAAPLTAGGKFRLPESRRVFCFARHAMSCGGILARTTPDPRFVQMFQPAPVRPRSLFSSCP